MITNLPTPVMCLGLFGFIIFGVGFYVRLGFMRAIFAVKGNPVFAPPNLVYGLMPLGLSGILIAFGGLFPTQALRDWSLDAAFVLTVLAIILAIWQPWWLKPKWLRWLEKEHGDIIEILWEEVRKEGHAWERRVRTQEQLEQWVAEVRRKHGL
jgi:hypothetical protein